MACAQPSRSRPHRLWPDEQAVLLRNGAAGARGPNGHDGAGLPAERRGKLAILERLYRQSQVATVYAGSSEIQRSQIAEVFLGLPRSR
ncbi:acyl-CoA dehydrogenase family protein [Novosphingobium pokkalii]|uniref:acyl-CoA dehydrogenase family protein n=1 Tax=Novosphingobium pokkalii TaxID=1770194 RepID=UPI003627E333